MSSDHIESELRSIEHALHAALVRQLRVISLMALLLGVAGFFVGHFVADEQRQAAVSPLEAHVAELEEQLAVLTRRCETQETAHTDTLAALNQLELLRREEAARDAAAMNSLLTDIENRRSLSLQELQAHVARRVVMPPEVVTKAINRFVDEHVVQLDRVLSTVERRLGNDAIAATRAATTDRAPDPPVENLAARSAAPQTTPATLTPPAPVVRAPSKVASTAQAARGASYFAPPERRGLMFFAPNRSKEHKPVRVTGADEIPLPPR